MNAAVSRLVAFWIAAALVVGGCVNQISRNGSGTIPPPARSRLEQLLLFIAEQLPALSTAAWLACVGAYFLWIASQLRDIRRRGTGLGMLFGGLAGLFALRRASPEVVFWLEISAALVLIAWLLVRTARWVREEPPPDREALPRTGLVAFAATATVMLLLTVRPA